EIIPKRSIPFSHSAICRKLITIAGAGKPPAGNEIRYGRICPPFVGFFAFIRIGEGELCYP
ncbi:hypothetical protein, partial [Pseudomonas fluorescens]|uniref:hypothetical protein n=1 Tax=Pseudomonas fluorescens TaxID=294 RepID=UPI001C83EC76